MVQAGVRPAQTHGRVNAAAIRVPGELENVPVRIRVLHVDHAAVSRIEPVVQARKVEAQRRRAQYQSPRRRFLGSGLPFAQIRANHRFGPRAVGRAVRIEAPVVDGDGKVVQQRIGAGVVEVDDAAQAVIHEQHVVAEQVGMDDALRQRRQIDSGLRFEFGFDQRACVRRQARQQFQCGLSTPGAAPGILHVPLERRGYAMHLSQHAASGTALREVGEQHALANQSPHHRRGPLVQGHQALASMRAQRRRTGEAVRGEVFHQAQEERQVVVVQALEQRQHPAAVVGVHEVVGVLHAFADALETDDVPYGILPEEFQ